LQKKGSLELTSREILMLILAIIIVAMIIGIAIFRLGMIEQALKIFANQGQAVIG